MEIGCPEEEEAPCYSKRADIISRQIEELQCKLHSIREAVGGGCNQQSCVRRRHRRYVAEEEFEFGSLRLRGGAGINEDDVKDVNKSCAELQERIDQLMKSLHETDQQVEEALVNSGIKTNVESNEERKDSAESESSEEDDDGGMYFFFEVI